MQLRMQNAETLNPEQIRRFLETGEGITFAGQGQAETYAWAQQLLVAQEYVCQGNKERGVFRAYLSKMTGLSMAHTARLIRMYRKPEWWRRRHPGGTSSTASTPMGTLRCWRS